MKILVFDVGGTSIKYAVSTNGTLGQTKETPTDAHLGGPHILDTLISLIEPHSDFDAIGISTAGQVNPNTGSIIYANSNIPEYTGMELRRLLEERFHVPVMVENDVNCAAMGEAIHGAGKDFHSFLCLTYGTGIGGAIVQEKTIFHGSSFSAGEFGAIVTHGSCKVPGNDFFDGCYERYASTTALVQSAALRDSSITSGRLLFEHLDRPELKEVLDHWIDEILLGLSTVIHIFNPSCIVLGGGIMVQPYIIEQIRERLPQYIMPSFSHVQIRPAELGNSAGMYGICFLTERYLERLNH